MVKPGKREAFARVVIMGNGGSGKTWLAKRLAPCLGVHPIHMDLVYWQPGRFGVARDKTVVAEEIRQLSYKDEWLMEGVYGWLINVLLPRATSLIFLDLPEEECIANVRARGKQGGETQEGFDELIDWVSKYRERRNNWNSFQTHVRMFDEFANEKVRLKSRTQITDYAERVCSAI
ncbi:AAA family ATPase [Aliirhizobium terrae]|uniref:AAA family ATPase n=1 Tax=Terrirhizobium terrae TaxID=2926709 RepID=UPI00257901EC|nr:AAA family ATPase [Rhizobium sp. CC-CFT758]WJH40751.1 AAA family ATPase [Rhizobium sp. CC-CFT758]